jgi:hypothetical protein
MLRLVRFLALHDPIAMILGILHLAFFGLHSLLHLKLVGDIDTFLNSRTLLNGFEPVLHLGEGLGGYAGPFGPLGIFIRW